MLCLVGALALCCVIVVVSSSRSGYSVSVGDISQTTITAPWDIVDEVTTSALIEEAKAKTDAVYALNSDITADSLSKLERDFDSFDAAKNQAKSFYVENRLAEMQAQETERIEALKAEALENSKEKGKSDELDFSDEKFIPKTFSEADVEYDPYNIDWREAISSEQKNILYSILPAYITDIDLNDLLRSDADVLAKIEMAAYSKVLKSMSEGIKSSDLSSTVNALLLEIGEEFGDFNSDFSFVKNAIKNDMAYNMEFDNEATLKAQETAVNAVEPIVYKEGQNIVVKGEVVTPEQYSVLEQSGLITETMKPVVYIPAFAYLVLIFILYMIYLNAFAKDITRNTKKMIILSILIVLAMLFCVITNVLAPNIFMIFSVAILATVLIDAKHAFVFSTFVSFVLIVASGDVMMFFTDSAIRTLVISVTGSLLAILVTAKTSVRAAALLAGLITAVPCSVVYLIMILMGTISPDSFGFLALWAVGGGLLCGVISIGLLPIFEVIFKIVTPAKLIELTDPRKKLLRKLMLEAPGTYHHSLAVGNLAENACEVIGADALLARAGAYYHDIGKLSNPDYFVENQENDYNPHDYLSPEESARVITAHVTDGKILAEKEKLPIEIRNIIYEHHGNTKVAYFLYKAKEINPDVDENLFRYHASKPTSKESAIIMLADSVEAAMRAGGKLPEEDVLSLIRKIIRGKYNDGQLDFTPITLKDLDVIAQVFAEAYKGREHKRIQYPEDSEKNNDKN